MKITNILVTPLFLFLVVLIVVWEIVLVAKLPAKLPRRVASNNPAVFARQERINLSPDNQEYCRWYLMSTRRFRIFGAIAGLLIGIGASELGRRDTVLLSSNWFFAALAGYFAGTLMGAWKSGITPMGTVRTASLRVRNRRDFMPDWMLQGAYGAAFGSLILLVASFFEASGVPTAGVRERVFVGLAVLVGATAADLGTRRLARAGRPSATEDVIAAFDAIVRTASSTVATAGLSLCLWLFSWSAFAARPRSGQGMFSLACILIGTVMLLASVTVWIGSRRGKWQHDLAIRP